MTVPTSTGAGLRRAWPYQTNQIYPCRKWHLWPCLGMELLSNGKGTLGRDKGAESISGRNAILA